MPRGQPTLRVEFGQTIARADYVQHLYSIFENFVGTPPQVRSIRGGGARDRQSIGFQTFGYTDFKIKFFIQSMNTKVLEEKNEYLKIFTSY